MIPNRLKRVSQLIKRNISDVIREEMKDPRIGFVSVIDVEVSPDLRAAKVFVSVMDREDGKEKTLQSLNNAAGFIHHCVKEKMTIKRIPTFSFVLDTSIERGVRLCNIIDSIRENDKAIE
jgi:ribosome-binding factor A